MPGAAILLDWYPALLRGLLLLSAVLAVRQGLALRPGLKTLLPGRTWLALLAAVSAALWLRFAVIPYAHQVYFDEFEHIDIAENLARVGRFGATQASGMPDLDILETPAWPGGYHVPLSLLLGSGLPPEQAAYLLNATLGSLTVALVFLLGALLFKSAAAGGLSALLLCIDPLHLRFSGSADPSIASVFWIAVCLLALVLHERKRATATLLLLLTVSAYAAHVRFENVVLAGFALAILTRWGGPKSWPLYAGFGLTLVPLPLLFARNHAVGLPGFGGSLGEALASLARNLPANFGFLMTPSSTQAIVVALVLFALYAERAQRAKILLLGALSAAFLVVFSLHPRGRFAEGAEARYALSVLLPLVVAAGLGLDRLWRGSYGKKAVAAVALAAYALFSQRTMDQRENLSSAPLATLDRFIHESAPALPRDVYVVAYAPAAIRVAAGRPSVNPVLLLENSEAMEALLFKTGQPRELVLFRDLAWAEHAETSARFIASLGPGYSSQTLASTETAGKTCDFVRLTRPRGPRAR